MAIERSRTETIRDFTAHAQGHQSMSMGEAGGKGSRGGAHLSWPWLAVLFVVAGGSTNVGADDGRGLILGIG